MIDRSARDIRALILAGARVRMGFAGGVRVWWIESPYVEISDETMQAVKSGGNGAPLLAETGDCLFGWSGNSQTWESEYA